MRIAQISPLIESVPPSGYGGTERVVSWLTEELVTLGHEVTLFASGDSLTAANLVPCSATSIRKDPVNHDPVFQYMCMLDEVWQRRAQFDIFHFHIDVLHFPLFRSIAGRTVTTLHGRQDLPHLKEIYRRFSTFPLVSISDNQRTPLPDANFAATVHHGMPQGQFTPVLHPRGGYLAFIGRISPEKGVDRAIAIARGAGLPLRIAAKVDRVDRAYFEEEIAPLLEEPGIEFIGEIGDHQKNRFLGDALALLFPIDWPEPFGLATIEAMACGTPVLAFRRGSVPEVVDPGTSGFIVESVDEAVAVLPQVLALDRCAVRRAFERRFGARRMAEDYVALYHRLLLRARKGHPARIVALPTAATPSVAMPESAAARPTIAELNPVNHTDA